MTQGVRKRRKKIDPDKTLRSVRALYMVVYNSEKSLLLCSTELFHILGDILEGVPPERLSMSQIDKSEVLAELAATPE
jgi:hypothetical protein